MVVSLWKEVPGVGNPCHKFSMTWTILRAGGPDSPNCARWPPKR